MRTLIKSFPEHITDALQISKSLLEHECDILNHGITNIVISGQGGSAIGGVIVKDLIQNYLHLPIIINKNYDIPSFINKNTLFIASSYSGNTEETLEALNKVIHLNESGDNVMIFCICSGGEMLEISKKHKLKHILIPKGGSPRGMLCYSVVQMLILLSMLGDSEKTDFFIDKLKTAQSYLINEQLRIELKAESCVKKIGNKMPFIYTFSEFEGVALRFKQQLNENSKRHATYNLIPEMNHNEIVAWSHENLCVAPVFIQGNTSFVANEHRMRLNIKQIAKNVENVIKLQCLDHAGEYSIKDGFIQYFYFIHLVDWISLIMAEKQGVDPNNIDPINDLKAALK